LRVEALIRQILNTPTVTFSGRILQKIVNDILGEIGVTDGFELLPIVAA
jgi:hypothetical protein